MAIKSVKAKINGQTVTLNYDSSSGMYVGTATAPSTSSYKVNNGHYYPVEITAEDTAGNTKTIDDKDATFGNALKLKVKEKVAPSIDIVSPTSGAFISSTTPEIKWKVTDADSGVNASTISIKIDNGSTITSGITKKVISNGYECSYTATLADGSHTIQFNASDNDGNASQTKTLTFAVDTVPPVLEITSPSDNLVTNSSTITVSGRTNDSASSVNSLTINGASVTVQSDGSFSKQVTLQEGSNIITVISTDKAGRSTTLTRTVTLDTVAPTFESVTIEPNPVDSGATYIIRVKAGD